MAVSLLSVVLALLVASDATGCWLRAVGGVHDVASVRRRPLHIAASQRKCDNGTMADGPDAGLVCEEDRRPLLLGLRKVFSFHSATFSGSRS